MLRPSLTAAALIAVVLTACDNFGTRDLVPGTSTAAEMRARMGEPAAVWPDEQGGQRFEYPKGPEGLVTFMIRVDDRGIVQAIEQVLDDAHFTQVTPGQGQVAVRRLLGRPATQQRMDLARETVWSWRIEGPPGSGPERHFFNVHFGDDGLVRRTSKSVTPLG